MSTVLYNIEQISCRSAGKSKSGGQDRLTHQISPPGITSLGGCFRSVPKPASETLLMTISPASPAAAVYEILRISVRHTRHTSCEMHGFVRVYIRWIMLSSGLVPDLNCQITKQQEMDLNRRFL